MTTGLFARTSTEATRHATSTGTTLRYLVVVSHDRPELFDEMIGRFRNSPDTTVISESEFARRDTPAACEDRRAIEANLWVDGYVIIRMR